MATPPALVTTGQVISSSTYGNVVRQAIVDLDAVTVDHESRVDVLEGYGTGSVYLGITLTSSWTGGIYFKKVSNIVTVLIDGIYNQSPGSEIVGTFPVGYRPGGTIQRVIGSTLASPGVPTARIARIDSAGVLTIPAISSMGTYCFGSFQFGF